MSFWTRKTKRITEEPYASIIREEYQEAKRRLSPLLSNWHYSSVKFSWDNNKRSKSGGVCWTGLKRIVMNVNYRDCREGKWTEEMFRMTLRHEIAHLVYANHGGMFLRALELLQGHRYVGAPAYTREKKVKPSK